MAEFGAHFSSADRETEKPPSIFDVLAEESLLASLKPAIKHVLRVSIQLLQHGIKMVGKRRQTITLPLSMTLIISAMILTCD